MKPCCEAVRAAVLLFILMAPMICSAQQYMKTVTGVTDATFDDWVKHNKIVKCLAIAQSAYPDGPKDIVQLSPKPSGVCYWDLDRGAELAPPTLVVHSGTRIVIRIKHPRQNETVLPTVVYAKVVPPSPGNDILKNAVNPLQAITLTPAQRVAAYSAELVEADCNINSPLFNPDACQTYIRQQINSIQASINHANAALACLETYQVAKPSRAAEPTNPPPAIDAYTCSAAQLIDAAQNDARQEDSFAYQKNLVTNAIATALTLIPPLAQLSTLDTFLTTKDPVKYSRQISNDGELKNGVAAIQTAQATLQQANVLLLALPNHVTSLFYYYDVPRLTTVTATITGTEIISKTNSTISTWTTSATSYNFVFSAGLGFSNLVYRTFANTPLIKNGAPVLNSSGNALSEVMETDTKLSVMAPEILGSYVIPGLRGFNSWCRIGCSVLVSGGIGANLTTKSADFDAGLSLRLMDVLLTPAVHFGRESRLSNGITLNEQLGANAPSTLPTHTKWVKKFGFVLTYAIPLP